MLNNISNKSHRMKEKNNLLYIFINFGNKSNITIKLPTDRLYSLNSFITRRFFYFHGLFITTS